MTTSDPADNGSGQPGDPSRQQPEGNLPAHPSGVPAANATPWPSTGNTAAWTPPGGLEHWTPPTVLKPAATTPEAPAPGTPVAGPEPDIPPPWSTPDTPTVTPPISGDSGPPPAHPLPPPTGPQQPASGPYPPSVGPHQPMPPGAPVPPYPPGPPLPPPRRDGRLALILGIIAALLLCCCAGIIASLFAWGDDAYGEFRDRTRRTIGLDELGRDGDFEFRVRAVECGIGRIGNPFVSQTPAGQYCLVQMAVRNIGHRPATISESLQVAYGPAGRQFGTDSDAVLLANFEHPVFLTDLNPGIQVTGILVYDIPLDSRIVKLELHSSDESRGLIVETD